MDLFTDDVSVTKKNKDEPLAYRMSPRNLTEFVGQTEVLREGSILTRAINADRITSLIIFGPPGCGKSALARVIAARTAARFIELNAVSIGVPDLRKEIDRAKHFRQTNGRRTIILLDEIHRFNRSQQDVLLPDVERGNIILIGLTTENPYFYINAALLSRSLAVEFRALTIPEITTILTRALTDPVRGLGKFNVYLTPEAYELFVNTAVGDARRALNALELAVLTTPPDENQRITITGKIAEESVQKKYILYDKSGDEHYDTISAYIKSIRGSDPDAAVYWLAKMLAAGEDPRFIVRRLVIAASEDIGNADPQALLIATAAAQTVELVGMPEAKIPLTQATIYVACTEKSNSAYLAIEKAWDEVTHNDSLPVPLHLRDANLDGQGKRGHGQGYKYPHNFPNHYVQQDYLPVKKSFYTPTDQGYEKEIQKRILFHRKLNQSE